MEKVNDDEEFNEPEVEMDADFEANLETDDAEPDDRRRDPLRKP